ncbi:Chemotaxis protein CheY [Patescibacteria group bacterium]|nr:Chemotaxis protein CheY [Patescibacteria group bacterium]
MNNLRVMVVDDSTVTIKKLTQILEQIGHQVVCISKTGTDALALYEQYQPDIVTMDITMPDMDGIVATSRIIKVFPNALIIMVTAHGQEQMVIESIEAGAKGYVLKPINPDKLQEMICKVYEKYHL